jgi:hypothetical protein
MIAAHALRYEAGASPMPSAIPVVPIVFIVDDDVSVRESLELLVRDENWKPETTPENVSRAVWSLTFHFPA